MSKYLEGFSEDELESELSKRGPAGKFDAHSAEDLEREFEARLAGVDKDGYMTCPSCHGRGHGDDGVWKKTCFGDDYYEKPTTCSMCGGSGKLNRDQRRLRGMNY